MQKNIPARDLSKVKAVAGCVLCLAISGTPVEAQPTTSQPQTEIVETTSCQEEAGVELVLELSVLEQQKIEKAERQAREFQQLVQQWRSEKGARSLYAQLAILPSYQSILAMGPDVLPLVFAQLESEGNAPDSIWFWALATLTHDNPVPPNSRGKLLEMAKAWIEWGTIKGYV